MNSHEQVLSFMDLLDLDEELIDTRLKAIMDRSSYTKKHLKNAIYLLQYKNMINLQEQTECENDEECTFVAKLLADVHKENIDDVCKIVNIVLALNKSTVVAKSEHLIQQILSNIELPSKPNSEGDSGEEDSLKALINLKLCDSILDAVIKSNEKLTLPFFETPLENLLQSADDKLKIYFLNNTVPKIFEGIVGYNILDRIWNYVKLIESNNYDNTLKILSCLSEFYLPVADDKGKMQLESQIIYHFEFWNILLNGLMSDDPSSRKISVYLIKRSIDCLITQKKDVHISSETNAIFNWTNKDTKQLKEFWNNFFILIDSLEEKQSNIVLPSIQLFDKIKDIDSCWINCAFKIGLKHDNTQVRLKCIEYRLKTKIRNSSDATVLLDAINDINLFDHPKDVENLRGKVSEAFEDVETLACILKVLPNIKWSPVPLYHISEVLATKKLDISSTIEHAQLSSIIIEILKIPCNNVAVRHAFKMNISYFVGNCCKSFQFEDYVNIYPLLGWVRFWPDKTLDLNPFICTIQNFNLNPEDKNLFFRMLCKSHENIDLALIYLKNHSFDLTVFLEHVDEKIKKIQDINNRQYSNKAECLDDVIYVTHLYSKTRGKYFINTINVALRREYKTITSYVLNLMQENDINTSIEDIDLLFKGLQSMSEIKDDEVKQKLLEVYRQSIIVLTAQNMEIEKKLYAIFVVELVTRQINATPDRHKIFTLKQILHVMKHANVKETANVIDVGRLRNAFYEKCCAIVRNYLEPEAVTYEDFYEGDSDSDDCIDHDKLDFIRVQKLNEKVTDAVKENLKELIDFVEHVIECGGYGCLRWILKIMLVILPQVLESESIKFNITQFIDRMWTEIEELKSNNQYSLCTNEFARIITHEDLLKRPMYNNIVVLYCSKIVEYGYLKNCALSDLVNEFQTGICLTEDLGHVIHIFCDILLFSPVPKKDHRIADNVAICVQDSPKFGWRLSPNKFDLNFNISIQLSAVDALARIRHPAIFESIASIIINKLENHFKAKERYHGNSQSHRLLLLGLQHLLLLPLFNQDILDSEEFASWMIDLLGKIPHQPSVRICLEWFISLRLYVKDIQLDETLMVMMKTKNIPLTSQFMILYWTLKHKLMINVYNQGEFEYVMDFLLSHTMGQMFNIRLHAQYLATKIFNTVKLNDMDVRTEKYAYTIEVIQKTFVESAKDKNFVKLQEDFFVNDFDIVKHYTPCFIYVFLPQYCEICDVEQCRSNKKYYFSFISFTIPQKSNTDFKKEWLKLKRPDEEVLQYKLRKNTESRINSETSSMMGTIQKKYIPWKNMNDINVFESEKKKETSGELIVVASLIDKLPNLGGMARTSEVFGVKTYVVDSLRHLQDKTFLGLSVSAERWVNIEEVRPGPSLKHYLMKKKEEGYAVVAAEQTSTSVQLQQFKFPKKTLLLLGHEKEGIPCDLLPLMDHCVEIPQQGFVRSLNVHVTAAIFVWEYTRQNVL